MFAVQRFYHASPALSTPHWRSLGHPHPPHLPLSYGDFQGLENAISYTMHIAPYGRTLQHWPLSQGPARCVLDAYVPRLITCTSSLGRRKARYLAARFLTPPV